MTYRDAGYWHGEGKFEKEKASELLATTIRSDNHHVKHLSLRAERLLKSLDESISFFIELLQVAYKNRENWQRSPQIKAGIAMANATLNYLFVARHAVILGYGAEAQMLYRGCFERMTRAVVFQIDERLVKRFWKGKQINQSEINNKISRYLEEKNEKGMFKEIYQSYKQIWKMMSELSHPNLETVKFRILSVEGWSVDESLGIDIGLGGMPNESVTSGIVGLMMHVSFSLSLMRMLVSEFLGKWNKKLDRKYSRLMDIGFDISLTELEKFKKIQQLKGKRILDGIAASPGMVVGMVRNVHERNSLLMAQIKTGEVLVAKTLMAYDLPYMEKASAFVLDSSGAVGSVAIVAKGMGKPAVTATIEATSVLKDGQKVVVDGAEGAVFECRESSG